MKTRQIFITSLKNELIGILLLCVLWSGAALFFPAYIIPSPLNVLKDFGSYLTAGFLQQLGLTLVRVMIGFSISFVVGTALGVFTVIKKWESPMNAMMMALQVLPGTILGVIFVLMFGIGSAAPIMLILFVGLPMIVVNTMNGLAKRNIALEEYLSTLQADKSMTIRYSFLPALVPIFQSNFSLGLGLSMKVVVLGEFIGSQDGLGFLLNQARIIFDMKEVFFYLVILLLVTLIFQMIQSLFFSIGLRKYYLAE
jgi:ABC-type nitrate/sulfonate/bicarbonate transport system permease component